MIAVPSAGRVWLAGGVTDILYGNQGVDSLIGGDGSDVIYGGQSDDDIFGDSGLLGLDGNDIIYGNLGNVRIPMDPDHCFRRMATSGSD